MSWPAMGRRGPLDLRVVYGANCSWWDAIGNVSSTATGLPCCPHCGGVLFECESEELWWADARRYESADHAGYVEFLWWARGKCFPSLAEARRVFDSRVPS